MRLQRILLFLIMIFLVSLFSAGEAVFAQTDQSYDNTAQINESAVQVTANTEGKLQTIIIPASKLLFDLTPHLDSNGNVLNFDINLKQDSADLYKQIGPNHSFKTVFVYPIFTQAAYQKKGFYDYYHGKCNSSCLTVGIPKPAGYYSASGDGSAVLNLLGYPFVTDIDIDKNPDILKQFDRVIMMHNEYVTKKEFDAITSHPDVLFLYPNALYAEVRIDYANNTITLVRGHGYPDENVRNGFGWKYDNSKFEFRVFCDDWSFYKNENYNFLDCYPDYKILYDKELLQELSSRDPTELSNDIGNWIRYSSSATAEEVLDNYVIDGNNIPLWVQSPAIWTLTGQISRGEFENLLYYLSENKIIH